MRYRPFFYFFLLVIAGSLGCWGWFAAGRNEGAQMPGARVAKEVAASESAPRKVQVEWEASAVTDERVSEEEAAVAGHRGPEDVLLESAVLLESRRDAANAEGRVREVRLWRTGFKHPLILEERWQGAPAAGTDGSEQRTLSVADHVLVRFPETMDEPAVRAWAAKQGFSIRRRLQTTPVYLVAAREASLTAAAEILTTVQAAFPAAAAAERDWLVSQTEAAVVVAPNDPGFAQGWGLHNTGANGGVADADIDAPEAWAYGTGSRTVKVAVIDSGIDYQHPDLAANMWANPGEVAGNGKDDDRNGYVDDVRGWDFYWNQNDPKDHNDHGTHCAGIIGAVGHNGKGIAGVNWQVSLMALRFLDSEGNGATSDAIEAVNYATKMGADVTSNSWGGRSYSSLLRDAIEDAGEAGIMFVTAAGNNSRDLTYYSIYPGSYSLPNIVSVAASTAKDTLASFSNFGQSVHLAAPGAEVYSTVRNEKYALKDGTSMAAPHVAGALALARSLAPELTVAQLKERLLGSVDKVVALQKTASGGRLNAARFIEQCLGRLPVVTELKVREAEGGNGDGILNPGEPLVVSFGVQNRGVDAVSGLRVTLSSRMRGTMFSLTESTLEIGDLAGGQALAPADRFEMTSRGDAPTPLAEEFVVTLNFTDQDDEMSRTFLVRLERSARVSGRIVAAADGAPLAAGVVQYSGPRQGEVLPDAEGRYAVVLPAGEYRMTAKAPGFLAGDAVVELKTDREDVDFALELPQLKVTPLEVAAAVAAGEVVQQTVTLENRGGTPLTWNLHLRAGNREPVATTLSGFSLAGVTDVDGGEGPAMESLEVGALSAPLGRLHGVRIAVMGAEADRAVLLGDLRQRGAVIVPLSTDFDAAVVQGAAMFLVDDSIRLLNLAQIGLLRERVKAGAGLLCEADDAASMSAVNTLFEDTGISAYGTNSLDQTYTTTISAHALTSGVKKLVELGVSAVALLGPPAQPLVMQTSTQAHAAATSLGLGTMVFVGNELTHTASFSSGDARYFANRIFDDCAGTVTWLTASASSGTLAAGASSAVTLEFDARVLTDGAYDATAFFVAGDEEQPQTIVPIRLQVNGIPEVKLNRTSIDFGATYTHEYYSYGESVVIYNLGTKALRVQTRIEGADAKAFSRSHGYALIEPYHSQDLNMRFWGSETRSYNAELILETDDVDEPLLVLPITASRAIAGSIAMPSPTLSLTLKQGTKGTATFSFNNRGPGALPWTAVTSTNFGGNWSSVDMTSGSLPPKGVQRLKVTADATALTPDSAYRSDLSIRCVDPRTSGLSATVKLNVLPAALIRLAETSRTFPDTFVKGASTARVGISNVGRANLTISSIKSSNKVFTAGQALPLVVPPGGFRELALAFKPTATGDFTGEIRLNTNAVTAPPAITVSATATGGPVLSVMPAKLPVLAVAADSTAAHTLEIANAGSATLEWEATGSTGKPALTATVTSLNRGYWRVAETIPGLEKSEASDLAFHVVGSYQSTSAYTSGLFLPTRGRIAAQGFTGTGGRYFSAEYLPGLVVWVADFNRSTPWQFEGAWGGEASYYRMPAYMRLGHQRQGKSYHAFVKCLHGDGKRSLNSMVICESATAQPAETPMSWISNHNVGAMPPKGRVHYLRFACGSNALLSEAQMQRIFETYIDVAESATPWLTVAPKKGSLDPDKAGTLQVLLDSKGLPAGNHTGTVVVTSNDPAKPMLKIPLTMRVTGAPVLACEPEALHVPQVWTGRPKEATLLLRNTGSQALKIIGISPGAPWLKVNGAYAGTMAAGAMQAVKLLVEANAPGMIETALTIQTNSAQTAEIMVPVTAQVFDEPVLTVLPTAIEATVAPGGSFSRNINLANPGGADLHWKAQLVYAQPYLSLTSSGGTIAPGGTGDTTFTFNSAGRYSGEYSVVIRFTSNAPAAPTVDVPVRIQVPHTGRPQAPDLEFPDTYVAGAITVPWVVRNSGNASLIVTGITSSHAACALTGAAFPFTLAPGAQQTLQARFAPVAIGEVSGSFTVASNAISHPAAAIAFRGKGIQGPVIALGTSTPVTLDPGAATVTTITVTNNGAKTLTWAANFKYLRKDGGTHLTDVVKILTPPSTTLAAGQSSVLEIDLHPPASLGPGLYTYTIEVTSNDAVRPAVTVNGTLTVRLAPRLTVTPGQVEFPDTFTNGTATLDLTLGDGGNGAFNITGITSTAPQFTLSSGPMPMVMREAWGWSVGHPKKIQVHFTPTQTGEFTGQLRFATNIPGSPMVTVPVRGKSIAEPKLAVDPPRIDAALQPGQSSDHEITINNPGAGGPLNWQAELVTEGPMPTAPHPDLEEVLARFDAATADLTRLLPALHDFGAGIMGGSIQDTSIYGSAYSGGNQILDPGDQWTQTPIPYSDGVVREHANLGAQGRYFTRHQSQMFLMAADLDGNTKFNIKGQIENNIWWGSVSGMHSVHGIELSREVGGRRFSGFFKQVFNISRTSINHLIVTEAKPGLAQHFNETIPGDDHEVTGLSGRSRVYYLMFATKEGTGMLPAATVRRLMDTLVDKITNEGYQPWAALSPRLGSAEAGVSNEMTLRLHARPDLEVGAHDLTVRLTSNAPANGGTLDVPVTLTVQPRVLETAPRRFEQEVLQGVAAAPDALALRVRDGEAADWTVDSDVAWLIPSQNEGTGSADLTLTYGVLPLGTHMGKLTITTGTLIQTVAVRVTVRTHAFTQLFADPLRGRVLGIDRGIYSFSPSHLAAITNSGEVTGAVALPPDITAADISSDGDTLYAISGRARSITRVDLRTLTVVDQRALPPVADEVIDGTVIPRVQAGRPGLVYYTDMQSKPRLHVFDYEAGKDLSIFADPQVSMIGGLLMAPDDQTLYASVSHSSTGGVAKLDASAQSPVLTASTPDSQGFSASGINTPLYLLAGGQELIYENARYRTSDLAGRDRYPSEQFPIAVSAYGDILVYKSAFYRSDTLQKIAGLELPMGATTSSYTSVGVFTADQQRFVYFDSVAKQLKSLDLGGISPPLPAVEILPDTADGALLTALPQVLTWQDDAISQGYAVYFGSDAQAVAAANPDTPGVFMGTSAAGSTGLPLQGLVLGQTYYWRVDSLRPGGLTVPGPMWSFRTSTITASPTEIGRVSFYGTTRPDKTATITLDTATADTPWTVSASQPGITVSPVSGRGPATLTVTLKMTTNLNGSIEVRSGSDVCHVPVKTDNLWSVPHFTKLVPDRHLPWIYALQGTYVLWINPTTAEVEFATMVSTGAKDLTVHEMDDRIYVLTSLPSSQYYYSDTLWLHQVERQGGRRYLTQPPPEQLLYDTTSIHAAGYRGVLRSSSGAAGSQTGFVADSLTGAYFTGSLWNNDTATITSVRGMTSNGPPNKQISFAKPAAAVSARMVGSADRTRLFWKRTAVRTADMEILFSGYPEDVVAASPDGKLAVSEQAVYQTATGTKVMNLPVRSEVAAMAQDGQTVVQFDAVSKRLVATPLVALAASPMAADFGQVSPGSTSSRMFELTNYSTLDVTVDISCTHPAFAGPAHAVTLNAGGSAQVTVHFTPTEVGDSQGEVEFSVAGKPALTRTVPVAGRSVLQANLTTLGFSTGAPSATAISYLGSIYSESGFVTTHYRDSTLSYFQSLLNHVGSNVAARPNNGTPFLAAASGIGGRLLRLARADGGLFSPHTVSLAEYGGTLNGTGRITFRGWQKSGAMPVVTFNLDKVYDGAGAGADFETFVFPPDFYNLVWLEVEVDASSGCSIDDLKIDVVPEVPEPADAAPAAASEMGAIAAAGAAMDVDGDGVPETTALRVTAVSEAREGVRIYTCEYARPASTAAAYTIQASRDGNTWLTLTPGLDYSENKDTSGTATEVEQMTLTIPAAADCDWAFRGIVTP